MTSTEPPVTLVTGAASGIGRATAELLLGRGGSVVAVDRSRDALDWVVGRDRATTLTGSCSTPGRRPPGRSRNSTSMSSTRASR